MKDKEEGTERKLKLKDQSRIKERKKENFVRRIKERARRKTEEERETTIKEYKERKEGENNA